MATTLLTDVLDTVAYFGVAGLLLLVGFGVLDLLTPGKLHRHVFLDHHVNATAIVCAQQIALGAVIVTSIYQSVDVVLWEGLVQLVVFGLLGIVLQAVALVVIEALVPGRFRDIVEDPKPRAGAFAVAVLLVVVGLINAVCLI